jgi:hypothetical protein
MKIETFEQYIKVTANEGFYITSYKEGDDITTYTSSVIMFAPLNTDLSELREISEEENNKYVLQLEMYIEQENGE